jgi:hypothetical protein
MNLKGAELEREEWIYLAQKCDKFRALVNEVMNFRLP